MVYNMKFSCMPVSAGKIYISFLHGCLLIAGKIDISFRESILLIQTLAQVMQCSVQIEILNYLTTVHVYKITRDC
jgi:hypothetical protein